jgi:tRNA(His) 5'-end guanylyltransferase
MNETAIYLCKNIQGAMLAYVQSDEISILLNNYKENNSQSWFDNNLEKMISVSAGMASAKFSMLSDSIFGKFKMAVFDSRAFVLPKEDVVNYFIWRQSDATRNSIQMLARTLYSHKELIGVDSDQLQELCFQKGINWNDCPASQKRGRCVVKIRTLKTGFNPKLNMEFPALRSEWVIDNEIPIFTQDRNYINRFI